MHIVRSCALEAIGEARSSRQACGWAGRARQADADGRARNKVLSAVQIGKVVARNMHRASRESGRRARKRITCGVALPIYGEA